MEGAVGLLGQDATGWGFAPEAPDEVGGNRAARVLRALTCGPGAALGTSLNSEYQGVSGASTSTLVPEQALNPCGALANIVERALPFISSVGLAFQL